MSSAGAAGATRAVGELRLRTFVPADDHALISWFPTDADLALFGGVAGAWPLTVEVLESRRRQPDVRAFSAQLNDSELAGPEVLAGHIELVLAEPGHVRLARVAIAPALRGHGLSGPLVDRALDEARGLGATTAGLLVVPGNAPALRSYERAGFADAGINPRFPQYVWMTRPI